MDILTIIISAVFIFTSSLSPVNSGKNTADSTAQESIMENATYITDDFYFTDEPKLQSDIPLSHIHLLHYDFEGNIQKGELIVNSKVANEVTEIFYELFLAEYPIHSIRPVSEFDNDDEASMSANNTSAYNYRTIAGSSKLSMHAKGVAIDINPLFNPCVTKSGISPKAGSKYADRTKDFIGKIDKDDLAYKLFTKAGWTWGGNWKSLKDYQHFEKKI